MQPQTPAAGPEQWTDGLRLHVAAAAHRVGVAPSTLRTWDRRYGIGPTGHTPGRHRRYSPDDLARLDLMHRALILGVTPADAAAHALTSPAASISTPHDHHRALRRSATPDPNSLRRSTQAQTAATESGSAPAGRRCAFPAPDGGPAPWGGPRSRSTPTPSADCSPSRSP